MSLKDKRVWLVHIKFEEDAFINAPAYVLFSRHDLAMEYIGDYIYRNSGKDAVKDHPADCTFRQRGQNFWHYDKDGKRMKSISLIELDVNTTGMEYISGTGWQAKPKK